MPLVCLMLARCTPYVAKRILVGDIDAHVRQLTLSILTITRKQIMRCNNPLVAVLIGTHVDRWSKMNITRREVKSATSDVELQTFVGSSYQSMIMWRLIVAMVLKERFSFIAF